MFVMSGRILSAVFAEFLRRWPDAFAEQIAEMINILIADFRSDLIDRHVCENEQILCFAESVIDQIINRRYPERLEKAA